MQRFPQRQRLVDAALPPTAGEAWRVVANLAGVSTEELAAVVAEACGLKMAGPLKPERGLAHVVPEALAMRHSLVPAALEAGRLIVAVSSPPPPLVLEDLRFATGGRVVEPRITTPEDIEIAQIALYGQHENQPLHPGRVLNLDSGLEDGDAPGDGQLVQFCRGVVRKAIEQRASDIHVHPFAGGGVVRFRIDGQLLRVASVTNLVLTAVIRLFKAQAGMDSTNAMVPQDGRGSVSLAGKTYDLRVSTLPASGAEALVIRLLDQSRTFSLEKTNFAPWALNALRRLSAATNGLVLITGPTGSGKTSTLYSLLSSLNKSTRRIITVEEPVEYKLEGLTQVDVNPAAGLTFMRALRAILRQDPDILLVGEIRDAETAEIAVQAALTGHLVLSTLHTQDAVRAIPRLVELGIAPQLLADTLLGVVSQRLMRQLCPHCKGPCLEPLRPTEALFLHVSGQRPGARATGCSQCSYTGYRGRFPVVEALEIPDAMRAQLLAGHSEAEGLQATVPAQWHSIEHNAANWVISGLTTTDEAFEALGMRLWTRLAAENRVDAPISTMLAGSATGNGDSAQPTALVITSHSEVAGPVSEKLSEIGHTALVVANAGEAAEALLRRHELQLLVVDLSHVDPERRAYVQQLRTSLAWSGLPVLAVYNPVESNIGAEMDRFSIDARVPVPLEKEALRKQLANLVGLA